MYDAVKQKLESDKVLNAFLLVNESDSLIPSIKVLYDKPVFGSYQLHLREYQNGHYGKTLATLEEAKVKAFFDLLDNKEFTFSESQRCEKGSGMERLLRL